MALITVALSVQNKEGKWFTKDVKCLRPHEGETILLDQEEFLVRAVALHAGEPSVVARAVYGTGKRLSARALTSRGFTPV